MKNQTIKNYFYIFFFASLFWITTGILHLGSLYLQDVESNGSYYLAREQWILFISAYFTWSFLTTFLYYLIERNPPSKENFRWFIYLSVTTIIWLIMIAIIRQYLISFLWGNPTKPILTIISNESPFLYLFNLLKVIMTYAVCATIFYYRSTKDTQVRLLNLQKQTAEALEKKSRFQLQALQSQLSPHFLFNALNSISGMARSQDYSRITKTVAHLGDLLRYTIEGTNRTKVTLQDEIDFVLNYIELQRIRFEGCFAYSIKMDMVNTSVLCPPFSLQTLVENVFSHNEFSQSYPISIQVIITQTNDTLSIKVENTTSASSNGKSTGIGLNNLRERLELLYGDTAQLTSLATENKFSTSIIIPARHDDD